MWCYVPPRLRHSLGYRPFGRKEGRAGSRKSMKTFRDFVSFNRLEPADNKGYSVFFLFFFFTLAIQACALPLGWKQSTLLIKLQVRLASKNSKDKKLLCYYTWVYWPRSPKYWCLQACKQRRTSSFGYPCTCCKLPRAFGCRLQQSRVSILR